MENTIEVIRWKTVTEASVPDLQGQTMYGKIVCNDSVGLRTCCADRKNT